MGIQKIIGFIIAGIGIGIFFMPDEKGQHKDRKIRKRPHRSEDTGDPDSGAASESMQHRSDKDRIIRPDDNHNTTESGNGGSGESGSDNAGKDSGGGVPTEQDSNSDGSEESEGNAALVDDSTSNDSGGNDLGNGGESNSKPTKQRNRKTSKTEEK